MSEMILILTAAKMSMIAVIMHVTLYHHHPCLSMEMRNTAREEVSVGA